MSVTVTKDETDKRVEQLRDQQREAIAAGDRVDVFDPTALRNPDPSKRYRWINKHPNRVSAYRSGGYETEKKREGGVESIVDTPLGPNGEIRLNDDLVLMSTPKANYEARRKRVRQRGEAWENAGREQAIERINRLARDGGLTKAHRDVAFDESGRR